jgi:hypothetical protein
MQVPPVLYPEALRIENQAGFLSIPARDTLMLPEGAATYI